MRKFSGFTLIELMIVVSILAILIAIALPAFQKHRSFETSNHTDHGDITFIVEGAGYHDVVIDGLRTNGCMSGESASAGFSATDAKNRRITGVVCSGAGSGKTIRLD